MSDTAAVACTPYEHLRRRSIISTMVQIAEVHVDQLFEPGWETSSMTYHLAGCGLHPSNRAGDVRRALPTARRDVLLEASTGNGAALGRRRREF